MAPSLHIDVRGNPVQQGSKDAAYNPKTGKTVIYEQNSVKQKQWRQQVISDATDARKAAGWDTVDGAVAVWVDIQFRMPRPVSVSPRRRPYPNVKPDLDKLVRNTLDGLTQAGVYKDDAQVIRLTASKRYATDDPDGAPGAWVAVGIVKPPEII